jgi:hypothetical protein
MFRSPQMWNAGVTQNWIADPATVQANQLPTSVNSITGLKKRELELEQEFCPPDEPDCEVLALGQQEEYNAPPLPPPEPTPAESAKWATIHHARFAGSLLQPGVVAGRSGPSITVTQTYSDAKPTEEPLSINVVEDEWHGTNHSMRIPSIFKRQSDACVLSDDSFDDDFGDCNCDD